MSKENEMQDDIPEDNVEDSHEVENQEDDSTEENEKKPDSKEEQSDESDKKESDWEGQDGADERERIAAEADKAAGLESQEEDESEKKENPDDSETDDSKEGGSTEDDSKDGENKDDGDQEQRYEVTIYGQKESLTLKELTERAEIGGATSQLRDEFNSLKDEVKELRKEKKDLQTGDESEEGDKKEKKERITEKEVTQAVSMGSDEEAEQALSQWKEQLREELIEELKEGDSGKMTEEEVNAKIAEQQEYAEGNARAKAGLNAYFESDDGKEFTTSQKKAELLRDSVAEECLSDLEKVGIKREQISHLNIERLMEGHQVHHKKSPDKVRSIGQIMSAAGTQTRKTIEELTGQPADQKPTETEVSDKSSEKEKLTQPSRNNSNPPKSKKTKAKTEQEVIDEDRNSVIAERNQFRD